MENINFILPEIFISLGIMFLLMVGVFKKNSSAIVYTLSIVVLLITLGLIVNFPSNQEMYLFNSSYKIDQLSTFMKIITIISGIFVLISSYKYTKIEKIFKIEYPILILCSILGMLVMISSYDLIVFYIGLELQSLSLYVLAAFNQNQTKSSEAGLKYFVLSALSSGLLLYGCSLIYGFSGSTNFYLISENIHSSEYGNVFGIVFILVGLAFKISAVPFHMWTPDVYQGSPTSVTSFFAVVPKIAGIAVFIRFMQIPFGQLIEHWQTILIFISLASMILGAVAAIGQTNIKRLIAYSSIGHIGYALAGISTGTIEGYNSSIVYISIYVVMNLGIFACVFLMKRDGKYCENINDLTGISKQHPLLSVSLLIVLFSLAGIPPLAGFFAKFYIFMSVIENKMYTLAIIGLLSTVISAFYYLRIIKIIYFDEANKPFDQIKNLGISSTLFLSCLILVSFFIFPSFLNNIVEALLIN